MPHSKKNKPPPHLKTSKLTMVPALGSKSTTPLTEREARAIAVDAYLYFYSLVSMDVTRRQSTNLKVGEIPAFGPMNMFHNVPCFPPADLKAVRVSFDTLYSIAWLDLTEEPVVVSVPDTNGRYYLLPMLDMWTDVFASPGSRTTGTHAANFLVTPLGWRARHGDKVIDEHKLPQNTHLIEAPTPYVWIIGRTRTDGPADCPTVNKIQAALQITPLSAWGKPRRFVEARIDPSVDMKIPPKIQVDTMPAAAYFTYAAELLKLHAPHFTDEPILERMKRIGIEQGKSFDISKLEPVVRKAVEAAPAQAHQLMAWKIPGLVRVANGWSINTGTLGVYGNDYLKRAMVAQIGLGANLPEDAIYPLNLADESGEPMDGANPYIIHFEKGATPPVDAFWSLTLYDSDGFQVGNALNRFALSSWMTLKYNPNGSLDVHIQNESPGRDKESNWLPAPKGPFNLIMRLYAPQADALTGKWNPPAIKKATTVASAAAQSAA
jgi:hypothetical protein